MLDSALGVFGADGGADGFAGTTLGAGAGIELTARVDGPVVGPEGTGRAGRDRARIGTEDGCTTGAGAEE
ncbi:MAG: hypothetical protein ABL998_17385 [Planctomycetota bacterium]